MSEMLMDIISSRCFEHNMDGVLKSCRKILDLRFN